MLDKNILFDGQKLKSRRISLKMSQSELAQDITTQATISLMENKNRAPNIVVLSAILTRLNLDIATLSLKTAHEHEIQELLIKLVSSEDIYNPSLYQAEKDKIKINQITDVYNYLMVGLDYFIVTVQTIPKPRKI